MAPTSGFRLPGRFVLHPSVSMGFGYDSNLYYQAQGTSHTAFTRVGVAAEGTRTGGGGLVPSALISSSVAYRENLDPSLAAARSLSGSLRVGLMFQPRSGLQVDVSEQLSRRQEIGAPAAEYVSVNVNNAHVAVALPIGIEALRVGASYSHQRILYDGKFSRLDSQVHALGSSLRWQVSSIDTASLHAGMSALRYSEASVHPESTPVDVGVEVGRRTTAATNLVLGIGYWKGFYERGGDASGAVGAARAVHLLGPRTTLAAAYAYRILDWTWGSYRTEHTIDLSCKLVLSRRTSLDLTTGYAHRKYGPTVMQAGLVPISTSTGGLSDDYVSVTAGASWLVLPWLRSNLELDFAVNSSELTSGSQPLGYARVQVLLGVHAEY